MPDAESKMTLREWLRDGPFALSMSSGFFGFYAHTGFLTVLEDEGTLPSRISGSSAGALAGGAWAGGVDAPILGAELDRLERRDFWDPWPGAGLLRGRKFREKLHELLPTRRFDQTRVPVALSVFDVLTRSTHVVGSGDLARGIHASCAVPFMFHPVWIDRRPYLDGGVLDRPGLLGMPEKEPRLLFHHLVSKSPWRDELEMPKRKGMITIAIDGLPRSGPFKLGEGRRAFTAARRAMLAALDAPIVDDLVIARV